MLPAGFLCTNAFDYKGNNSEKLSPGIRRDMDDGESVIFWSQLHDAILHVQAFNGEFSIQGGDDDGSIGDSYAAIDHQNIAIIYTGASHALSTGSHEIGCCRVSYTQPIQIQRSVQLTHCR